MEQIEIVAAVIIRGKKVLAVERREKFMKGRIDLPAGHLEDGESRRDAVKREVLEETGYHVKVSNLPCGEVEVTIEGTTYRTFLYTAEIVGEQENQCDEVARILWTTPKILLESAIEHNIPRQTIEPIISKISNLIENQAVSKKGTRGLQE
jgi:8-oxo-dGTP diphosphatase